MYPLGQKLQEKLLNPVPRSRHNPTGTATRDPQPKARPLSVPLFSQGSDTYAYAKFSPLTRPLGDLVHRPSGAASLRWSSSSLKTAQSVADGYTKEVRDFNIARGTAEKIEQTKDSFVKQRHAQPDSGTFTAVVLAQRWLGRLRLQDPHPMTRKLQQASQTSYRQQKFIPESQIRDIVRDEVIQAELSKSNKSVGKPSRMLKAPVVSKNYESYRKILAILYLMKRPSKIRLFVKAGLCDDQLPFKKAQHLGRFDRSATLTSRNTPGSANIKFTRPEDADEFLDRQWSVLAPVFSGSDGIVPHDDFKCESILPFLPETTIAKEGGSSKVFKAKIHPDHHNLCQPKGGLNIYAVKTLKSKDDRAFRQEVTVLRRLSTSKHAHAHLITLLATYKQGAAYHLIFPWADADLFDYWKRRQEAPPEHDQTGAWVIEQCRGLADGLNSVHRYATFSGTSILDAFKLSSRTETDRHHATYTGSANADRSTRNLFGRHGDLKPQNILWYPDSQTTGGHGVLKITDFGVTRFNTENMWDTQKTGKLPNSPTYRSPESDLDGKLTTACDVWALGCVYLEFVAWYFGGYRLVQRFGEQRLAPDPRMANMRTDTFFTIVEREGEKTADVKPAVLKVIKCKGSDQPDDIKPTVSLDSALPSSTMTFTILSDADVQTLLHNISQSDVQELASALNQALIQYSCNDELPYQPHRANVTRPNGQVSLFMPATTPSSIGVKMVGVAPSQTPPPGEKPKPALRSVLTICDELGQAVGVLNAAELTAFRTSLGSMLLYRYRKKTENIIVFGAGKQAEWHIRLAILLKGDDIRKITIVNRSSARAKDLVDSLTQSKVGSHIKMEVFEEKENGLEDLITEADVMFCTTPSTSPLFPASYLLSDSGLSKSRFISAIGSYRLDMQEIDPELLKHITNPSGPFASQVHQGYITVDSIKGCMDEAGELVAAGLKPEQMLEAGKIDGLREDEGVQKWLEEGFVVYKSVGVGIMDIAIGKSLMDLAAEKGVGVHLDSF
ncbi:unnamed protein product [Alternaria alternata]